MDLKIRQLFAPSSVDPTNRLVATIAALLAAIVGLWQDLELPTIERNRRVQSWLPKSLSTDVRSCFRLSEAALAC